MTDLYDTMLRWSLPVLIVIGLIEGIVLSRRQPGSFDWKDWGTSLGVTFGYRVVRVASKGLLFGVLLWIWQFRLFTVPLNTWWGLTLLFLGEELSYYWEHRINHRSRWFWASHAVHHSPEQLRLSAAYRLAWTGLISGSWMVFVPMILLGFHPAAVFAMLGLNLLYQFWLHNEWMPKLGAFEYLFNTPSHHRVHHASNPEYIDRNYGGVLIIFDRWFGTYAEEQAPCRYGLVHPVNSYNPFWVVIHEWCRMFADAWRARGVLNRLGILFMHPGWQPQVRRVDDVTPRLPESAT
jgi:sterol desaturase/sphingolipid hydroxylase (fatty acid hydroxylase superfamily)